MRFFQLLRFNYFFLLQYDAILGPVSIMQYNHKESIKNFLLYGDRFSIRRIIGI